VCICVCVCVCVCEREREREKEEEEEEEEEEVEEEEEEGRGESVLPFNWLNCPKVGSRPVECVFLSLCGIITKCAADLDLQTSASSVMSLHVSNLQTYSRCP